MKQKELTKDEKYWKVLEFLDQQVKEKKIEPSIVISFKETVRDNKYVSTYIRALKEKMQEINNIDDFIQKMDKWNDKSQQRDWNDLVDYSVRKVLGNWLGTEYDTDPVKIIHNVVREALEREGKICDFQDSVNPDTKIGRCENDNHDEIVEDEIELTDEEQKKFDEINEKDGWMEAVSQFYDKFNPPNQELYLTLYQDEDTSKFDDTATCYVCEKCRDDFAGNGECEVSCDME